MAQNDLYKKFSDVKMIQSVSDRLSAILHAFGGLHNNCNPFQVYYEKLTSRISSKQEAFNLELNSSKSKIDHLNESYRKTGKGDIEKYIATLSRDIELKKNEIENAEQTKLFKEEEITEEFSKAKTRYQNWYETLGRPPYYDIFNYKELFKTGSPEEKPQENKNAGFLKNLFYKFFSTLKTLFKKLFYLAYPAEVYFALPAFQFITPENKHAAIAGAVILVGALYVLGHFSGMLLIRSRTSKVPTTVDSERTPKDIKTSINFFNSSLLVVSVMVALVIVLSGTALRTMVYDVERNNDEIELLNKKIQNMRSDKDSALINNDTGKYSEYDSRLLKLADKLESAVLKREGMRNQSIFPHTTDGYLAVAVYLALYFAPLLVYITRNDPYFEYSLIAQEAFELNQEKNSREYYKYQFVESKKKQLSDMEVELIEAQKELEIRKGTTGSDEERHIKDIVSSTIGSFKSITESWRKQRMLNYFSTYMLLRGKSVRKKLGDTAEGEYLK